MYLCSRIKTIINGKKTFEPPKGGFGREEHDQQALGGVGIGGRTAVEITGVSEISGQKIGVKAGTTATITGANIHDNTAYGVYATAVVAKDSTFDKNAGSAKGQAAIYGENVTLDGVTVTNTKAYEYAESLDADESTMPLAVADARSRRALTGVVEATKLSSGSEDELRLEISGSRGASRFSLMDPHYLEYFDATIAPGRHGGDFGWKRIACGGRYEFPESEFPSPKSTTGWIRAHVASLAAFYHAIGGGASVGADFHQALRVQDALDAVKRSAEERTWIKMF